MQAATLAMRGCTDPPRHSAEPNPDENGQSTMGANSAPHGQNPAVLQPNLDGHELEMHRLVVWNLSQLKIKQWQSQPAPDYPPSPMITVGHPTVITPP
jgi:hypothetical protein